MKFKEIFYPEAKFGGFTDIDGTVIFYNRVNSLINSNFIVLDVGCGRGVDRSDPITYRKNLRNLKGKVRKVIGIDIDQAGFDNPFLDEFHLIQGDTWPIESNSIDLIVCDSVLEHVSNPDQFFSEIRRVLQNDGFVCIRTTNQLNYISIAASIIPNKYHSKIISIVQSERKEEDVFSTFYKCNSIRKIKQIMNTNGIDCVVYGYEAEPSYLSFSKIAYFFGVVHQKYAPGFIKPAIFAFGQIKKESDQNASA